MGEISNIRSQPRPIPLCMVFDARGNGDGVVSPTLTGDHQNRITDYTAICVEVYEQDSNREEVR